MDESDQLHASAYLLIKKCPGSQWTGVWTLPLRPSNTVQTVD